MTCTYYLSGLVIRILSVAVLFGWGQELIAEEVLSWNSVQHVLTPVNGRYGEATSILVKNKSWPTSSDITLVVPANQKVTLDPSVVVNGGRLNVHLNSVTVTDYKTFWLSPNGSDDPSSTNLGPFRTLARVRQEIARRGINDGSANVFLLPGTYPAQELPEANIYGSNADKTDFNRDNVILDGSLAGSDSSLNVKGGVLANLTIQNLSIDTHWANAAVSVVKPSLIQNVAIRGCKVVGLGVRASNVTLHVVLLEHNLNGLTIGNWQGGVPAAQVNLLTNVMVKNTQVRFNNLGITNPHWAGLPYTYQSQGKWYVYPKFIGGGGKISFTDGVTLDNFDGYMNLGPGMWFDGNNCNMTVRNSRFYDNQSGGPDNDGGIGLAIEVSYGPAQVTTNNFYNNHEAALAIWESNKVTVKGNTFGWNGTPVRLRDGDRDDNNPGSPKYRLTRTRIEGNAFALRSDHRYVFHENANKIVSPSLGSIVLQSLGVEYMAW